MAKLCLQHDRKTSIAAEFAKMQPGENPQLGGSPLRLLEFLLCLTIERLKGAVERGHQDLFFGLEVEVHGTVGYIRALGDVRHPAVVEAFLGDHIDGRFDNPLVFVPAAASVWRSARGNSSRFFRPCCRFGLARVPALRHVYGELCTLLGFWQAAQDTKD